jgi:isocitrate dehydrogenase kinase/phosphatase
MSHFPKLLSSQYAYDIARTLLDGFDKHYRLFRAVTHQAKAHFEASNWSGIQQLQRERIAFYDKRVYECTEVLQEEYDAENLDAEIWQQVKLHYIGLLTSHHQPELAETFFNSVLTRILNKAYFNNDFIFMRPAVSNEYIENEEPPTKPTYRTYYPGGADGLADSLREIIQSYGLKRAFKDLDQDIVWVLRAVEEELGQARIATNFQIHTLTSLFFRNKGAYIVGRIINGDITLPLAIPIRQNDDGTLRLDTVLLKEHYLQVVFSYTHSYFLVDMEVPSAYVTFLRSLMPSKPRAEIYSSLGLQKQGKALFWRDYVHHLRHSTDNFRIAPGIKGLVMLVFDLPSYPYVFKIIKDYFPAPKETTRELIMSKYELVKKHDRAGRMADTLEFTNIAFPLARFEKALLDEIDKHAPSIKEIRTNADGEQEIVFKHLYIERRMTPLNIWLMQGTDEQVEHGIIEYGRAIKDLIAANIFPGDMLYKNFGVTRHGRVVFYDYDEIEYLTDCNIRKVPAPRNEEDEMSGEVWYNVGPHDIFPETYNTFLLGDARVRKYFMKHHADFFEASMWQSYKNHILAGEITDIYPYDPSLRFAIRYSSNQSVTH